MQSVFSIIDNPYLAVETIIGQLTTKNQERFVYVKVSDHDSQIDQKQALSKVRFEREHMFSAIHGQGFGPQKIGNPKLFDHMLILDSQVDTKNIIPRQVNKQCLYYWGTLIKSLLINNMYSSYTIMHKYHHMKSLCLENGKTN